MNSTIKNTKCVLLRYYQDTNFRDFKHFKHLADDYELPRKKAYKAYLIGKKLFEKQKEATK